MEIITNPIEVAEVAEVVLSPLLTFLDYGGVAVFALSGALIAAREKQTFVTMAFFALITGVGGGTIRDVIIGIPAFWIHDPWIALICLGVATVTWFTPSRWWEGKLLEFTDGAGLTGYAAIGTAKALSYGVTPVAAMLLGVITGCAGGIIRDIVAGRPSILMKPELYVTAAALAAALCAGGLLLGLPKPLTYTVATLSGFALRAAAIRFGLSIPSYVRDGDKPAAS